LHGQIASQEVHDSMKGIPDQGKLAIDNFVKEMFGNTPTMSF